MMGVPAFPQMVPQTPLTARQWQGLKMHPTQFNSNKNRPGFASSSAMRAAVYEYLRKKAEQDKPLPTTEA